jgi:hypothetical protein
MSKRLRSSAPGWAHWGPAVAALACAFALAFFPSRSDDVFLYLAIGRRFFADGHFPSQDPFLFTGLTSDWLAHWGTHLLTYGLFKAGGWNALELGKVAVVLLGACATLWVAWRVGESAFLGPATLLLGLWAGCDRFIERSSLLGDVCGAWVLALACAELVRPTRWRWALPPIFLVWVNLHPGVMPGLGFVGAAAMVQGREWRRWVPVLAGCLAACCVHPNGVVNLWRTLLSMMGSGFDVIRQNYWEFMPTMSPVYLDTLQVRLFIGLLLATLAALVLSRSENRLRWFGAICFAALSYLGLTSIRFVTTASLSLPVLVAALGSRRTTAARLRTEEGNPGWRRWRSAALATAVAGAVLTAKVLIWGYATATGPRRPALGLDSSAVPVSAASFVKQLPFAGRIFNEHSFGAFLAYAWDGDPKLFYHGHVMIADPTFYARDYLGVNRSAADFDRVVRSHDISLFFLRTIQVTPTAGPLLYQLLLTRPEWHLVYWDPVAAVFLRGTRENMELVAEYEYRYFDPFRRELLGVGLREAPERVRLEATRALRDAPRNPFARRLLRLGFGIDPEPLLRSN